MVKNKVKQFIVKFRADDSTIQSLDILCEEYRLTRSQVLRRLIDIGLFNETIKTLLLNDEVQRKEAL